MSLNQNNYVIAINKLLTSITDKQMKLLYLLKLNLFFKIQNTKNVSKTYDEEDPMEKAAPPMAYLYLGMAFHLDYKFDDALKMFETYESYLNPKKFKDEVELVEHYKSQVHNAQERYATPINVVITNMGDSVNSQYSEISPVLSAVTPAIS